LLKGDVMTHIYVPRTILNTATNILAGVVGGVVTGHGIKVAKHHFDKLRQKLDADRHDYKHLTGQHTAPSDHVLLAHTDPPSRSSAPAPPNF
jgi:hypothetical protein